MSAAVAADDAGWGIAPAGDMLRLPCAACCRHTHLDPGGSCRSSCTAGRVTAAGEAERRAAPPLDRLPDAAAGEAPPAPLPAGTSCGCGCGCQVGVYGGGEEGGWKAGVGDAAAAAPGGRSGERLGDDGLCRVTLAISASRASAGEEAAAGLDRPKEACCQLLPPAAAAGVLNDAARSAARRQRLLGAACSLGALLEPRLLAAAASEPAAMGPTGRPAGASPVAVRRRAVIAALPGVAAGCFSICSSCPSSCKASVWGAGGGLVTRGMHDECLHRSAGLGGPRR